MEGGHLGVSRFSAPEQVHADFAHCDARVGIQGGEDGGTFGFPPLIDMARVQPHHGKAAPGVGVDQIEQGPDAGRIDVGQQQPLHARLNGAGHGL